MPRTEINSAITRLNERITELNDRMNLDQGGSTAVSASNARLRSTVQLTFAGLAVLLTVVIYLANTLL